MDIGAHVSAVDPLGAATQRGADLVQIFLGPPQSYEPPPERTDAEALRGSALPIYVHAPYVMNLASRNPRVRHPARKTLQQTLDAAARIGARGVVVHGGHLEVGEDPEEGFVNWRKALDAVDTDVPILIENTAGGDNAMARHVDAVERLWEHLDGAATPFGFCLDTCHLHAAGEELLAATDRLLGIVGTIDLVHLNDSRDPAGSARDRHQNLGHGRIDPAALVEVVRAADAPVVVETPDAGAPADQAADIAWIRERLGAR